MASEPSLSICIPTFNRPQQLLRCIDTLVPQLNDRVRLFIFDNASDPPAAEVIAAHAMDPRVSVYQNRENIGCVANIMRAIETPSTSWVWVIGDDDEVRGDAVSTMMAACANAPANTGAIHFASRFSPSSDLRATPHGVTLDTFLARPQPLLELSFLGQFVLRREAVSSYIKYGYHFAYSCFPHMAVLLMTLAHGHTIWMWPRTIHNLPDRDLNRTDHYRAFPSVLGAPTLAELPLDPRLRRRFVELLGRFTEGGLRSAIFDGLIRMKQPELRYEAELLLSQVRARIEVFGPALRVRSAMRAAVALQRSPHLAYALAHSIYKRAKGTIDEGRFMRPIHARLL